MYKRIIGPEETLTPSVLHMETINKSRQNTWTILTRPTSRTEVTSLKSSDTFSNCILSATKAPLEQATDVPQSDWRKIVRQQ